MPCKLESELDSHNKAIDYCSSSASKIEYLTILSTPVCYPGQVEKWPSIPSEWLRFPARNSSPASNAHPPSSYSYL